MGSWAAEALARTGVGHITLVDADVVATSNINRQLPATAVTVGEPKVDVLAARMRQINPDINVVPLQRRYTDSTSHTFSLDSYDVVIDAIDSLADKASLLLHVSALRGVCLLSSMGAALKSDPTRIRVAEFWQVKGCPLAAALRRRFKRSGCMPRRKFKCVYSDELLSNLGPDILSPSSQSSDGTGDVAPLDRLSAVPHPDADAPMSYGKVAVNGALCHITAIFGMTLAGLAVTYLSRNSK